MWGPRLRVPFCLRLRRRPPGAAWPPRGVAVIRAMARQAQVPIAGEGAARRRPSQGGTMAAAAGAPGAPALGKGLA